MGTALGFIGFWGGLVALIWLVVALIRRKPKRVLGFALLGFFVSFVVGVALTPTPEPTQTSTPRLTPEPTSATIPTATPRPTPTPEPTQTSTPRLTPEPTSTTIPAATPTATPTPRPTANPTATPTPRPTATPTPIPTPTPLPPLTPPESPFDLELKVLIAEYERNLVLANSRFRYVANGQQPITITGFVQEIEENYFKILPEPNAPWYSDGAQCYYANAREALHLYRDQPVTVTGRVSGENSGDIVMFMCDVHEVELETNPTLTREQTRDSVVRVHCEMGRNWLFESEVYGTGVVVDSTQGLILTAHHVVEEDNECENITVEQYGGKRIPATLVKHCASIDQAYIRVEGSLSDVPELYEASAQARDDQTVYFWGWGSEGLRWANGIVTDDGYSATSRITFNARAVAGDSGSPVFNEFGHLLGILTSSNRSDLANYYAWGCDP